MGESVRVLQKSSRTGLFASIFFTEITASKFVLWTANQESKASHFSYMSDSSLTHDEFEDNSDSDAEIQKTVELPRKFYQI